jgi:MFS family permease
MAVNGVVIVLLQPFTVKWVMRWPQERVLAGACVLFGVGFGLNGLVRTAPLYAVAVAVWTLGEIAASPVSSALVAELAPPDLRGRYQGVFSMTWGVAAFLGPALGTFTMERLGARGLWAACLVVGLLLAGAHLAIAGPRRRALAQRAVARGARPASTTEPRAA